MEFNFNVLLDEIMLASIKKENPTVAKMIRVFTKRGISVTDAMAMIMEIGLIAEQAKNEEGETE